MTIVGARVFQNSRSARVRFQGLEVSDSQFKKSSAIAQGTWWKIGGLWRLMRIKKRKERFLNGNLRLPEYLTTLEESPAANRSAELPTVSRVTTSFARNLPRCSRREGDTRAGPKARVQKRRRDARSGKIWGPGGTFAFPSAVRFRCRARARARARMHARTFRCTPRWRRPGFRDTRKTDLRELTLRRARARSLRRRGHAPVESVRGALTRSGVASVPKPSRSHERVVFARYAPRSNGASWLPKRTTGREREREERARENERERETEGRERRKEKGQVARRWGGGQIDFSPSTGTSDRVERSEKRSADGKSNEELITVLHGGLTLRDPPARGERSRIQAESNSRIIPRSIIVAVLDIVCDKNSWRGK